MQTRMRMHSAFAFVFAHEPDPKAEGCSEGELCTVMWQGDGQTRQLLGQSLTYKDERECTSGKSEILYSTL